MLVFLLAFIPIVGATLAGIIAALVALVANGPVVALIVVGVVVLVNQLEGNFLQPVLMGRSMKLNSLVILIALTVGALLSGVIGAVLAVPITAVAWGAVQVWDGPTRRRAGRAEASHRVVAVASWQRRRPPRRVPGVAGWPRLSRRSVCLSLVSAAS